MRNGSVATHAALGKVIVHLCIATHAYLRETALDYIDAPSNLAPLAWDRGRVWWELLDQRALARQRASMCLCDSHQRRASMIH